jgi:hypothetical protein
MNLVSPHAHKEHVRSHLRRCTRSETHLVPGCLLCAHPQPPRFSSLPLHYCSNHIGATWGMTSGISPHHKPRLGALVREVLPQAHSGPLQGRRGRGGSDKACIPLLGTQNSPLFPPFNLSER